MHLVAPKVRESLRPHLCCYSFFESLIWEPMWAFSLFFLLPPVSSSQFLPPCRRSYDDFPFRLDVDPRAKIGDGVSFFPETRPRRGFFVSSPVLAVIFPYQLCVFLLLHNFRSSGCISPPHPPSFMRTPVPLPKSRDERPPYLSADLQSLLLPPMLSSSRDEPFCDDDASVKAPYAPPFSANGAADFYELRTEVKKGLFAP